MSAIYSLCKSCDGQNGKHLHGCKVLGRPQSPKARAAAIDNFAIFRLNGIIATLCATNLRDYFTEDEYITLYSILANTKTKIKQKYAKTNPRGPLRPTQEL